MAISATFQADFTSWKSAVDAAETQLRGFQTGASQVEGALKRVADSFSGRKILSEASLAVKAIGDMGGVAKLTEAEQKRLNSTLTEAIAKYQALGQTAPKAMTDLEAATRRVEPATKSFGSALSTVNGLLGTLGVGLSVGAVMGFGKELLRVGDELVKVADRTGLTTEEVQKLQFIAGQSGNSLDDMTAAVSRLQKGLVGGDKSVVSAVANLGLNFEQLKTANPYEQMELVAEAMAKIENPAERAKVAIDLFGRAGAEILPTLISNFKDLGDAAPVMSDKTARALDQAGDALHIAGQQMKVWAAEAYNSIGRTADRIVAWNYTVIASYLNMAAKILELTAKLPGGAKALELLGISTQAVRKEAQWFTDAAGAMKASLDRVDVAVRKVVPIMGDYETVTRKSGSAGKVAAAGADEAAAAFGRLALSADTALRATQDMYGITLKRLKDLQPAILELVNTGDSVIAPLIAWPPEIAQNTITAADRMGRALETTWERTWDSLHQFQGFAVEAVSRGFADMITGARSFKEGFLDIWRSIQNALSNILSEILQAYISKFIKGLLGASTGLGGAGGVTGQLGGYAASALGLGGAGIAGGGAAAGGSAAGTAATVGGGIGVGTTIAVTGGIAAAAVLAWAIYKKGLFRGGEESLKVNPARDEFLSKFGAAGTGADSGFRKLADQLFALDKNETLFKALTSADHMDEFESAILAINARLQEAAAAEKQLGDQTGALTDKAVFGFDQARDAIAKFHDLVGDEESTRALTYQLDAAVKSGVKDFQFLGDEIEAAMKRGTVAALTMRDLISKPIDVQINWATKNLANLSAPSGGGKASQSDIEKFLRENPGDIHRLEQAFGNVTDRSFAGGTGGRYVDFGSGTMIMAHGREKITPEGEESGGGGVTLIMQAGAIAISGVNKNPEQIAREIVPAIVTEIRRNYQGTRSQLQLLLGAT